MLNKKAIRKFKSKLILNGKKISEFAEDNKFNPAVFSMALNGHTNMREYYQKAIERYLKWLKTKQEGWRWK